MELWNDQGERRWRQFSTCVHSRIRLQLVIREAGKEYLGPRQVVMDRDLRDNCPFTPLLWQVFFFFFFL